MSRLVDRCLLLAAGGVLGFMAARGPASSTPPPTPSIAEGAGGAEVIAAGAVPAPAATTPPRTGTRPRPQRPPAGGDAAMDELVDEVVRLRPDERRRPRGPLTQDEIDRCLVVARDVAPELHRGLMALREADPEEFRRRLAGSDRLRFLAELRADEPHLYELKLIELRTDREVARLSEQLRAAASRGDDTAVRSLRPQLVTQMRMQQAFILLARKQAIDRMREKLEAFERRYQRDVATVDERIQERVDAIITDAADTAAGRGGSATGAAGGRGDGSRGGASREPGRRR